MPLSLARVPLASSANQMIPFPNSGRSFIRCLFNIMIDNIKTHTVILQYSELLIFFPSMESAWHVLHQLLMLFRCLYHYGKAKYLIASKAIWHTSLYWFPQPLWWEDMTNICQASIPSNVVDKTASFNLPTEAREMADKTQSITTLDWGPCAVYQSEVKPENLGNKWVLKPSLTLSISCQTLKNLNFCFDNTHGSGDRRSQCLAKVWNLIGHHCKKLVLRRATHIIQKWTKSKTLSQRREQEKWLDSGATLSKCPWFFQSKTVPMWFESPQSKNLT